VLVLFKGSAVLLMRECNICWMWMLSMFLWCCFTQIKCNWRWKESIDHTSKWRHEKST